jgi:hypothetical protein
MGPRQEHFRMLALYNLWANARLYAAAGQIAPETLAESGAFFRLPARDPKPPPRHRPPMVQSPGRGEPARHAAQRGAAPRLR